MEQQRDASSLGMWLFLATEIMFFGGMFVVTSALWSSGAVSMLFMNYIPTPDPNDPVQSAAVISAASIGVSQVLS